MVSFVLLIIVVSIASYTDITAFRIPNWLCTAAIIVGMMIQLFQYGVLGLAYGVMYALAGGFPLFLLYLCKGVGAGDVKLFAGLGAIIGIPIIFNLMILSFLCAGIISLLFVLLRLLKRYKHYSEKLLLEAPKHYRFDVLGLNRMHQFPFMLAVAPATCILWFLM